MPAPVLIACRPLVPRLLLLFWIAEIVVGALFFLAGVNLLGPQENGGAVVLMLMGLVLVAAGLVAGSQCWRAATISGHAIEMTEAGLLDRRLSARIIPWEAIGWKLLFNGRSYAVYISVSEPGRSEAGIAWHARAAGLFNKLLRHPEFSVASLGTGLSAHEIAQRMAAFKPAQA